MSDAAQTVFSVGRIAVWVVLALLVVAVVYAAAMSLLNWTTIGV